MKIQWTFIYVGVSLILLSCTENEPPKIIDYEKALTTLYTQEFIPPSGEHIKPLDVYQWSLGYAYKTEDRQWQATAEVFYKTFDNMVEYKNGADLFLNDQIETQLLPATGEAYGFDGTLQKTKGIWTGEVNYTFSRSTRKTTGKFPREQVRDGNTFPSNFDRPHAFNFNLYRNLNAKWKAGLFFTYQSGRPTTPAIGQFKIQDEWYLSYAERNSYRLPDLHRLDLSFTYTPDQKSDRKWKGSWVFGIYNAYGAKNVFSRFSNFFGDELRSYEFSAIAAQIPFINYNFKF